MAGRSVGRVAAGAAVAACLAACASRPATVAGVEAFRALQQALRDGDGPVVFAMLAPPLRAEWLRTHPGADDPAERWARHLEDPASGWPAIAQAELLRASQPAPDTTDLELTLPQGGTTTLRLRHANRHWYLLVRTVPG